MKKKHSKKKIIKALLFAALMLFIPVLVFSADLYVDNDVSGDPHYNTLALAYADAVSGDTIHINKNIAENLTLTKSINITSDVDGITWDGAADANPTLYVSNNTLYTVAITNITMDHSYSGGGYVLSVNNNEGLNISYTNCTIKRTSTSTTSPAVFYWASTANNNGTLTIKESVVQGTAYCYGFDMEATNKSNNADLQNTIITGFTGSSYAAIYDNNTNDANNVKITNCTIVGNYYGYRHGATCNGGATGSAILNTVFAQNTVDMYNFCAAGKTALVTYCAFEEATSGYGTGCVYGLVAATEFINPGTDWHIASSSVKLRNMGTSGTSIDYDGTTRPQESITDIGAFEYSVGISAAKSANVSYAYLGDTITFCLTVTNSASTDMDIYIWDTVPSSTTYIGCDNGCTFVTGDPANGMPVWFLTLGAGQNVTRCFWVRVTSYPFIIRQGEFFAGVNFKGRKAAAGTRSIFAIDDWKYWMAFSKSDAVKN